MEKTNILFICSKNKWRSPTAEKIYKNDNRFNVRSAGVSESSKRKVSFKDIEWADLILVMEQNHKSRIRKTFREIKYLPPIESLDIPDDFQYMDPELIELIKIQTEAILSQF